MTDREFIKTELQKLQKILEARADMHIGNDNWNKATNLLSFETACSGALKLLKEQEGTINELQNAYSYLQKQFFEVQDELLKEQEAVPVIQREVMHMLVWCCGSCGAVITDGDKFCRMCGRRMKWE